MTLVWTKSKMPLSVLIRWALNEPVSHFAIVFNEDAGCGVLFQSNLLGTGVEWYETFLKKATIVYSKKLDLSNELEDKVWSAIVNANDGRPYNWLGFFYFCWRALLFKVFSVALPSKGIDVKGTDLCVELYNTIPKGIVPEFDGDLAITTPYGLWQKIKDKTL